MNHARSDDSFYARFIVKINKHRDVVCDTFVPEIDNQVIPGRRPSEDGMCSIKEPTRTLTVSIAQAIGAESQGTHQMPMT